MALPISGRRLDEEHEAMVAAGVDPLFRIRWLRTRADEWLLANRQPGGEIEGAPDAVDLAEPDAAE